MSDQNIPVPPYGSPIHLPLSRTAIPFPLTRTAPVLRQILTMLLYYVLITLSLMSCLLYLNIFRQDNWGWYLLVTSLQLVLVIPAATVLCGALFGSWRGTLVSLLAIGSGLLFTHLLNNSSSDFQGFLNDLGLDLEQYTIPGLLATLVVGLIYDFRKYVSWWKSMLTMLLGTAIVLLGLLFNPNGEVGLFACCMLIAIIPFSAYIMMGIEFLSLWLITARQQRQKDNGI